MLSAPTQMTTLYSASLSGSGTDIMAGTWVTFAVIEALTVSPGASLVDVPDHYLRAGWIAFGDAISGLSVSNGDYWRPPIFVNWDRNLWTPVPTNDAGLTLNLQMRATKIRWFMPAGSSVYVQVEGT